MPWNGDVYVYNPLERQTYEALAFNAIGRASEINNLSAYGLSHSTGNSGWSVGLMQWDFGQPGRGDGADEMLALYQAWAPETQRLSEAQESSLSMRLKTRGQTGNLLSAEERVNIDQFLRSDGGRAFVGALDRRQVDRKWDMVGEPLSQIEWLQTLSRTDAAEVAEIVAMTSKLYNQNEIRGGRLIEYLQENAASAEQTSNWIENQGIQGLNASARLAILGGRDKALAGVRLMNSLETGDGPISRLWREEIHGLGNVDLVRNYSSNASAQMLDKSMRDPLNGERIRARLDENTPGSRILMAGGSAETSRVELDQNGRLTVRSPEGFESVLTRDGWTQSDVIDQGDQGQGPEIRGGPPDHGVPPAHQRHDVQRPGRPEPVLPYPETNLRFPGLSDTVMHAAHPDYPMFAALKDRLPSTISDDMVGHVMLQAKLGGLQDASKLHMVVMAGENAFVQGKTPGERTKVDITLMPPPLTTTLLHSYFLDQSNAQQRGERLNNQEIAENPARVITIG